MSLGFDFMFLKNLWILAFLFSFSVACKKRTSIQNADVNRSEETPLETKAAMDAVGLLNENWKKSNRDVRVEIEERMGAPILFIGHENYILREGQRLPLVFTSLPEYDVLKTFAHVAPNVFLRLSMARDGKIDDKTRSELKETRRLLREAKESLANNTFGLDGERVAWQHEIADLNAGFLDRIISSQRFSQNELNEFTSAAHVLNMRSTKFLTEKIVKTFLSDFGKIVDGFSEQERKSFIAVISGGRQHRRQDLRVQTLAKIMGVQGEGERIVFIENTKSHEETLDLFRAHLSDAMIGRQFFADSMRMSRELMGDFAQEALESGR